MRSTRSRPLSPRAGTLSSLCLILAVGLAIILECQQLTRGVQFVDARRPTLAANAATALSAVRADSTSDRRERPSSRVSPPSALPIWKPGFQWHYRWSDQRGSGTYVRAIIGEEIVDGVPYYVMRTGNRNIYWATADLAWLMEQVNGEIESQAVPAYRKFVWPLEPGKTWVARYQWTHPGEEKSEERTRRHRVASVESVQVPAGTYQALRVVVADSTGKKLSEYWYAPQTRWLIKERLYFADGVRDRELLYASLWPKAAAR
jgi:hypothetical protein